MVLTVWCVGTILGSVWLVGGPLAWLLNGRRPLAEADCVLAPFLGVAAIILVSQNLVYLNLPIRRTAPFVCAAAALAWVWMWRGGGLRGGRTNFPWALSAAALLVYLVQGMGLLAVGPRDYVGRAWTDQFNYTALAQYFCDEPFHTAWDAAAHRPYTAPVIAFYKDDRIGQSVLHGFFTAISFLDAKTLFQPTILLGPALTVFAVFALARRLGLGKGAALTVAAAAGLMPGLAMLQLESFLSHSLGLPLLLVFPAVLDELNERPDGCTLARAALVLTAAVSVYTEFLVLLLAVAALTLAVVVWGCTRPWRLTACYGALVASLFALNPGFAASAVTIVRTRVGPAIDPHVYPWASTIEGLGRIWLGDWAAQTSPARQDAVRLYALTATAAAFLGLAKAWLDRFRGAGRDGDRRALGLASGVLAIAMLPLLVLARDDQHPYQFYKLLITASPLLVLGLYLLWFDTWSLESGEWRVESGERKTGLSFLSTLHSPLSTHLLHAVTVGVLLILAAATARMTSLTRKPDPVSRSNASVLRDPDVCDLQRLLPRPAAR